MSAVLPHLLRAERAADNTRQHRKRVAFAVAGALLGLVLAAALAWGVNTLATLPVGEVVFKGDVVKGGRIDPEELKRFAAQFKAGIGTVDLNEVRAQLKRIPWVREAAVRRAFPHTLIVTLEAHQPFAFWGEHELLNTHGERFSADYEGELPTFAGPSGSEQEGVELYKRLAAQLKPHNLAVEDITFSPRRSARVKLADGTTLELGREAIDARISRFLIARREIGAPVVGATLDFRYQHGFAVRGLAHSEPNSVQKAAAQP